ncbi:hypothetical protein MauCBS54593_004951 [Microsporum audouinii]
MYLSSMSEDLPRPDQCINSMCSSSVPTEEYANRRWSNQTSATRTVRISAAINNELVNRLSFPMDFTKPRASKMPGSQVKVQGYPQSAAFLNISLAVFDEASHWISSDAYSQLCEEFVPLDMAVDTNIVQRLAMTLTEYQIAPRKINIL